MEQLIKLNQLREEFHGYDNAMKSDLLIEYADRCVPVPESLVSPPYPESAKVPACESEAYLFVFDDNVENGLRFRFAIENPQGIAAKALAVILEETLSEASPAEIATLDESLVYDFFGRNISMGKGQGLMAMVQMLRSKALRLGDA